jgi:Transposase DDE domain
MVACRTVCLRRLAQGCWPDYMGFWRLLANRRVSVEKLVAGWSDRTRDAVAGRHVLAIQDTSEIKFATNDDNRRGLGKVKKGNAFGVLLHAMIAVDADGGGLLGLAGGKVWTRQGDNTVPHGKRALSEKESSRWIDTAEMAKESLAQARLITIVGDRESDIYAHWALTPGEGVHLLTRLMHDHAVAAGGTVSKAVARQPVAATAVLELRQRPERKAHLSVRFTALALKRPQNTVEKNLPASVPVNVVEVIELNPPKGAEPVHWILLTTHRIATAADAWRMVEWYKLRWTIEQLFRTLKLQGLRIEDSQLASADRLLKLVAIAAKAAAIVMQLVQARDGRDRQPAGLAFTPAEIAAIDALNTRLEGKTERQRNPHPRNTLAWAAWVIAKLGGWHEYQAKPPGPITFHNGLTYFRAFAAGWEFKNV